jgi:hypothetical protein
MQIMSDTLIGVLIGSGLSFFGVIISAGFNLFLENRRNQNKHNDSIKQKRAEVYLRLYKLYNSYSVESANERKKVIDKQIYEATLELEIYGSEKIIASIEPIQIESDNFSQQIESFRVAIRTELEMNKPNNASCIL